MIHITVMNLLLVIVIALVIGMLVFSILASVSIK